MTVLEIILKMLDEAGCEYRHIHHEPTHTSAEAAHVRGESIKIGGKSLLLRGGSGVNATYALFVLSAALRLDSVATRKILHSQRSRFATPEELMATTGLVPGSVPPFGDPVLPGVPMYVDQSIFDNDRIAFNAGSLTDSIIMQVSEYQQVANIEATVHVARN